MILCKQFSWSTEEPRCFRCMCT